MSTPVGKRPKSPSEPDPPSTDDSFSSPVKRPRKEQSNALSEEVAIRQFRPDNMSLVSVLLCDSTSKRVILHTRLDETPDKDAIVILEKTQFPKEPEEIVRNRIVHSRVGEHSSDSSAPKPTDPSSNGASEWRAKLLLSNDVYHRMYVSSGLDLVNGVDMTVIYPAEEHHFKKYAPSGRRLYDESAETYTSVIVPFLAKRPRDLSWVENILSGEAEADRVIFSDPDPQNGFTLVLDYRWNGRQLIDLHCLGIARNKELTCLRDLRATHVPLLKRLLEEGRRRLSAKYSTASSSSSSAEASQCEQQQRLDEDQIMAYFHYPPTFYHAHVHFIHVNSGDNPSLRTGRAHLVEDVIRNLELDSEFYSKRTMTIYLHENSPMFEAVHPSPKENAGDAS